MPHLRFQLPKRVTKKFNSSRSPKKCIEIRRLETNPISLGQQHQRAVLSFVEVPGYKDVTPSGFLEKKLNF
jgi:hypothetical protein